MFILIWSCFFNIGSVFNCVLPEALKITAVQHDPQYQPYKDSEKRRLRSSFSCLSSISSRQKQLSTSSLLLQSPLKGCLRPWELKKPANRSLKERSWFHKLVLLPWNVYIGAVCYSFLNSYFWGINVREFFWSLQMCILVLVWDHVIACIVLYCTSWKRYMYSNVQDIQCFPHTQSSISQKCTHWERWFKGSPVWE